MLTVYVSEKIQNSGSQTNFVKCGLLSEKKNISSTEIIMKFYFCRSLNLPVTGHSFEDTLLMAAATKHGLPPETGVIEFNHTAAKLG